ncbi:MAG: hypothetical protein GY795_00375 [Desulfobacterales bacterium]|nr:hypothetical protein [Desulfobacterales bacterium]
MKKIKYSYSRPAESRRHYINEEDTEVLLNRLPSEVKSRLKGVHFNDCSYGARRYGYVNMGHREIAICALPPRVSCTALLRQPHSPGYFGAAKGSQWPSLAVRRFMLYDVFLHELGHLQKILPKSKSPRRKFAGETKAQNFVELWRRKLWSEYFDHPDPVHNPPSEKERDIVSKYWPQSHEEYKKGLLYSRISGKEELAVSHFKRSVEIYQDHEMALERLGILIYSGKGVERSNKTAIDYLRRAVRLDPASEDATLFLAMALGNQNRIDESEYFFQRAIKLDRYKNIALSFYGEYLARWGNFNDAEAILNKAVTKVKKSDLALRIYARILVWNDRPDREANIDKAIGLLEKAAKTGASFYMNHFWLGYILFEKGADLEKAKYHLEKTLKLKPSYKKAEEILSELNTAGSAKISFQNSFESVNCFWKDADLSENEQLNLLKQGAPQ